MIETLLYQTLSPLVDGRVFPDVAPFGTQGPYITYQQAGGQVIRPYGKEVADSRNSYMQVNVWSTSRLVTSNLALQVEEALITSPLFIAQPQTAFISVDEPDTGLRGTIQEFSIWSDRQ